MVCVTIVDSLLTHIHSSPYPLVTCAFTPTMASNDDFPKGFLSGTALIHGDADKRSEVAPSISVSTSTYPD